ncbi:protein of unknown function [Nitrospira japonica]|uniref:Uncharacterized protein n=1 Tax=Nitrospira japonica TaxID=1325564 RepID=A0A1W1I6W4_9BACT|nr:protein of unknown function [Nitrospira japonica]
MEASISTLESIRLTGGGGSFYKYARLTASAADKGVRIWTAKDEDMRKGQWRPFGPSCGPEGRFFILN